MKYSKAYQYTHDIDWFRRIGDTPMHFASNGGLLPNRVNDREINEQIQQEVALLQDQLVNPNDIIINREYVHNRLDLNGHEDNIDMAYNNYIESFVSMARKGLVSFDREVGENTYIWIARPLHPVRVPIEMLPQYTGDVCESYSDQNEIVHVRCLDCE